MAFCDLVSISGSKTIRFRASFQQVAPSSFGRAGKDQVVGQAVWPAEVFFDSVPARETARRFRLPGRTGPPPKLRRVYQARQIRGFLGPRIRLNRFARRAVEPFSQSLIPAIATGQPGNPVLLRQGLAGETACPTSIRRLPGRVVVPEMRILPAVLWGCCPPASLFFVRYLILLLAAPLWAQTMTDDDLFRELDLSRPGLEAVSTALRSGSRAAGRHALAEYYRHRTTPSYYIAPGEKANPKPARPDTARAERALRHEFESIGYPHTFGEVIDWHFDKTAEPGSPYAPNNEWTWQLNRHAEWLAFSRAYRDTGDEKYAREFVAELTGWVK